MCDLPGRFGRWKTVYERHRLWSPDGTWERLLQHVWAAAAAAGEIDWDVSVDSTIARAHQHAGGCPHRPAANPPGGDGADGEGLGRSRGGFTTKIHLSADGRCRPLSLIVTPGQRADCTQLKPVLEKIRVTKIEPGRPRNKPYSVAADKAYSNGPCREYLRRRAIRHTIPEKGDLTGVSDEVLDALARALQLTEDESAYLYDLARTARRPQRARRQPKAAASVPQQVQLLIDAMSATPVIALSRRLDVLASNALGRALFDMVFTSPTRRSSVSPPNLASVVFLDPAAAKFYDDLDDAAAACVRILRAQAGATPHDKQLTQLVGELSTRSTDFRSRWAAHDVGVHRAGRKTLHHQVGELILGFEELTLDSSPSITLSAYIAEPASPTAERLQLLAAWAATTAAAHP
ncbi:IS5 family transposase [Streptomyces antibioticus]|uniref:IS5 family transposase n=1 Tax=Streptomyces antibioticus TaxID=1890 RepID=UPI00370098F0